MSVLVERSCFVPGGSIPDWTPSRRIHPRFDLVHVLFLEGYGAPFPHGGIVHFDPVRRNRCTSARLRGPAIARLPWPRGLAVALPGRRVAEPHGGPLVSFYDGAIPQPDEALVATKWLVHATRGENPGQSHPSRRSFQRGYAQSPTPDAEDDLGSSMRL